MFANVQNVGRLHSTMLRVTREKKKRINATIKTQVRKLSTMPKPYSTKVEEKKQTNLKVFSEIELGH